MQHTRAEQLNHCFKILSRARKVHEEARGVVSPTPRIDRYKESTALYEQAASQFEKCFQSAETLVEKRRTEAWKNYCLAMMHGDRANARYFNPSAARQSVINDAATATSYISQAQAIMPWGEIEQRDEQIRWKILGHSFRGLMHKSNAQKLQQEDRYREASEEFLVAANTHSKAATLAEGLDDQVAYQRIMARVWSATSSAFECRASMSKGKVREKYLNEAEKAARQAIQFRPHWTPLQQVFTEVVLMQEHLEREKGARISWIQFLIGFLLGITTDLIFGIVF